MPTDEQIQRGCMNHYFFLATATQYDNKQIIICGENQTSCKYAKVNGVIMCTAIQSQKNIDDLISRITSESPHPSSQNDAEPS